MVTFPNCKINIGLRILSKRADGFHNLETVFIPIPYSDVLEIITDNSPGANSILFTQSGHIVSGNQDDNLCVKACRLLQKDFPQIPSVKLHLHKAIPMGAGLGGGSSNAAFTLKLLNEKYQLNITEQQLINYALTLGSDCPFFIINKPAFASGRGEILTPVELNLSSYQIVLVNSGIHINTGWAFSQLNRSVDKEVNYGSKFLREIIAQPVETWRQEMINDFEQPVFNLHPQLKEIKENMYKHGAVFAAMSGSGSTVFGLFNKIDVPFTGFPSDYFIKTISMD